MRIDDVVKLCGLCFWYLRLVFMARFLSSDLSLWNRLPSYSEYQLPLLDSFFTVWNWIPSPLRMDNKGFIQPLTMVSTEMEKGSTFFSLISHEGRNALLFPDFSWPKRNSPEIELPPLPTEVQLNFALQIKWSFWAWKSELQDVLDCL